MITSLRLQNFRSYADQSFEFDPGVNIVIGPNASGKTNLLEGILVTARGSSFRAKDAELVRFGKQWARLDGFFGGAVRSVKLESSEGGLDKSFLLDDKPFKRLSLERAAPTVLFEPNHLQLAYRGPQTRRDYLDDLLERTEPGYKSTLAAYRRALAQRNALLKQGAHRAKDQMFAWNVRLSELGGQLATSRQKLIEAMNKQIGRTYNRIAQRRSRLAAVYQSQLPIENYSSRLLAKLEASERLDLARGFTGYGPHRDDLIFMVDKQPAQAAASRGEIRSLVLALKIFEMGLIEKLRGEKPVFLLDDVFSELDGHRRHALVEYLGGHQVLITTTDADSVIAHFTTGTHHLISL